MTDTLSPAAREALRGALSSRWPSKGLLLQTAPSPFSYPAANAAWSAAMMACNPFKVSIVALMLMLKPEHRQIYEEIKAYFDAHPELKHLDRDRP